MEIKWQGEQNHTRLSRVEQKPLSNDKNLSIYFFFFGSQLGLLFVSTIIYYYVTYEFLINFRTLHEEKKRRIKIQKQEKVPEKSVSMSKSRGEKTRNKKRGSWTQSCVECLLNVSNTYIKIWKEQKRAPSLTRTLKVFPSEKKQQQHKR